MKEIIKAIERCAVRIEHLIHDNDREYSSNFNATGDNQLKIDIQSDIIIEEEFEKVSTIKELISEEKNSACYLHSNGIYSVGYDPLDGSSLIDVNLSVGSIFAIYKNGLEGKNLIASMYVVYGPRVEMVVAIDDVKLYRLIDDKFIYVRDLKLKEKCKFNATGGTQKDWLPHHKALIEKMFKEEYYLRYSGGMVPDLHFLLLKGGGLFSYPATKGEERGKLRMLFEVFPFAYIYEKAGGGAIDGKGRLLDLKPSFIHDTTPCFFGSNYEIELVKEGYK